MRELIVHGHHKPGKCPAKHPRGFTALIVYSRDSNKVLMRASFCAPKDQFNKKLGVAAAREAKELIIDKRNVPEMISKLNVVCKLPNTSERDWFYLLKYML